MKILRGGAGTSQPCHQCVPPHAPQALGELDAIQNSTGFNYRRKGKLNTSFLRLVWGKEADPHHKLHNKHLALWLL